MKRPDKTMVLLILAFLVAASAMIAVFGGPRFINPFSMSAMESEIVLMIRLPRVITAMLMGAALGAAGAVLQGMLRNPLADPYILGLSSGATLFAAGAIISGISVIGGFTIPLMAFIGAMSTGAVVGVLGYKRGGLWPERLLLAGIGVGFLCSAILMLMMSMADSEGMRHAMLWIFGDLGSADWPLIPYGAGLIAAGIFIAEHRRRGLNSLMLGDDLAHSLGFSPRKETALLFTAVGLLTAASVSMGGMIGFIGLLIPHIMRFLFGADNRLLIPASAMGGSALLLISDLIGRTIIHPAEIPAGVVTAIIGAPYFLYLLRRRDVLGI